MNFFRKKEHIIASILVLLLVILTIGGICAACGSASKCNSNIPPLSYAESEITETTNFLKLSTNTTDTSSTSTTKAQDTTTTRIITSTIKSTSPTTATSTKNISRTSTKTTTTMTVITTTAIITTTLMQTTTMEIVEDVSTAQQNNMTYYQHMRGTYYGAGYGAYGRWGRTLISGYSVAINGLSDGQIVYIESSSPNVNGYFRVDDTGGMGYSTVDFFYSSGCVPSDFAWQGVIQCDVYLVN